MNKNIRLSVVGISAGLICFGALAHEDGTVHIEPSNEVKLIPMRMGEPVSDDKRSSTGTKMSDDHRNDVKSNRDNENRTERGESELHRSDDHSSSSEKAKSTTSTSSLKASSKLKSVLIQKKIEISNFFRSIFNKFKSE